MLTFAIEKFSQCAHELAPVFGEHWREIALDKDKIKLAPWWERYASIDDQGMLHLLIMRIDGQLVGYYMAYILPHMHYRDSGLQAVTDAYFILPKHRKGGAGAKLLKEMERTLKKRGCVRVYISTKVHQDHGPLFEKMGFLFTDKMYTKLL